MRRPLIQITLLYTAGILLPVANGCLPVFFAAVFFLLALVIVRNRSALWFLCPVLVLTGWINHTQSVAVLSPRDIRNLAGSEPAIVKARGILCRTPMSRTNGIKSIVTQGQLDLESLQFSGTNWTPAAGRISLLVFSGLPEAFHGGQRVEIEGVISPPPGPVAEGLFDYSAYLRQTGIYYQLRSSEPGDCRLLEPQAPVPIADRFLAWGRKAIARGIPNQDTTLELEWALSLGWKQVMTEEVTEPFVRAATYHIFAVDGLRIAIVAGVLITFLRVIGVSRILCGVITIPLLLFYGSLTNWPASAIRAIAMVSVIFAGWMLKRPPDMLNSLFAAALLILIWEPRQLFQAGFQLSFVVVLSIILISPFFETMNKRLLQPDPLLPRELAPRWKNLWLSCARYVLQLFTISVVAWLGSIPLVAYYFHIITPSSSPANVPAVPLCALVLISNFTSLLLAPWFPMASELFNHSGWLCMRSIELLSKWFADWPAAYYYVSIPSLLTIALYYAILIGLLTGWLFKGRWALWKLSTIAIVCAVWCMTWFNYRAVSRVTVLPLEKGHAVFARLPGWNDDWLVDCGNESDVQRVTKPWLRAQGVNRLPHFIITHGEAAYTDGAADITDLFQPASIVTSPMRFRSKGYRAFEENLSSTRTMRKSLHSGDREGPWTVLHPSADDKFTKAADGLLVLRGDFEGVRVLLLSDLGQLGERALLARTNDLRADIVITGLPESGEALSPYLVERIQPQLIIVADAAAPSPRRAKTQLKERLASTKIPAFYTGASAAVTISMRNGSWKAQAMDGTRLEGKGSNPPELNLTARSRHALNHWSAPVRRAPD